MSKEVLSQKSTGLTFEDLGLSNLLLESVKAKGFTQPTEIQEKTIPLILENTCDLVAQAQTGTGKTASFALPLIDLIDERAKKVQAVVVTPTRELANQINSEFISLCNKKKLRVLCFYGGQSIKKQIKDYRDATPHIVVGTPGRVIDLLNSSKIDFSDVRYAVIDEADEMLNEGFIDDVEYILSVVNKDRRVFLFSATMPAPILNLAKKYMKDYQVVSIGKKNVATSLTKQTYFEVHHSDKLNVLCRVIDMANQFYGLVFCRTKVDVDSVTERLIAKGYKAESMHGDLNQFQRERVLKKFRSKICRILIVTDVASRGLDIQDLSHVINYDLPQDSESYVHRVGRTGRAGKTGFAISFVTLKERKKILHIKKSTKADIIHEQIPTPKQIVEHKKNKFQENILEKIDKQNLDPSKSEFDEFIEDILDKYDAKTCLKVILSIGSGNEFSLRRYPDITPITSESKKKQPFQKSMSKSRQGGTRLFVMKGRVDGTTIKSLVNYVSKVSKIAPNHIQNVEVLQKFSFITLSSKDASRVVKSFQAVHPRGKAIVDYAK